MPPSVSAPRRTKKIPPVRRTSDVFATECARLTPEQRRAVETIEGPVMVLAGPGTGKTQVTSLRIAQILRKTHARPSNILCLTFSVTGATAMRERLRAIIGSDAYGVTIATVHSFCERLIEDHPAVFDQWAARSLISDVERIRELNTIIDQDFPHSDLIHPKDPHGKTSELIGRISQVKREGKVHADLERAAQAFDQEMAEKSRPGTKVHDRNLRQAKKFRDFIQLFRSYDATLKRTGRYDYEDMILVALRALEEEEWLLASFQERYQYLLVDEAQDLNGAQWKVIERLITYPSLPHEPNLFLVGDDDQSIYRFQGANLEHMLAFRERFPKAPIIPLTVSFRSTQAILSSAERLIEKNDDRLTKRLPGITKHLTAASGAVGIEPKLLRAPSDQAEPWLIADLVEERLKSGVPASEIAVLVRKNRELLPLFDVLRACGIPVILSGKSDLLTHPMIRETLTILDAVSNPRQGSALVSAIACSCFAVHPADLARVTFRARAEETSVLDIFLSLERADVPLTNPDALIRARDTLLDLQQKRSSRTVLETVEHVLRECGLLVLVTGEEGTREADPLGLAAVETFFQYVKARSLEHPFLTLEEFGADLAIYKDPTFDQVRLTFEIPHLVTDGVRLMTAHQSKGLEFQTVILANFRDGHWDRTRERSTVTIPEHLLYGWQKEEQAGEKHDDERRLAYVAMTRAKRELLLTCPKEAAVGEKSRPISPSAFFAEAGPLPEEEIGLREPEKASLLLRTPVRAFDAELTAYLRSRLEEFALSPTSLNRFLEDPQEFLRIDLLGQPEHFDEGARRSLSYGSAVHWALKTWGIAHQQGKDCSEEQFLRAFEWYLTERCILTKAQHAALLELGRSALPRYFAHRLVSEKPVIRAVERELRTRFEDIPLKGKIDRIDLLAADSARATVIDFKTGSPKGPAEIRGSLEPGSISTNGDGAYFRQLVFYALLLELGDPLLQPETFALEFIGERGADPIRREFPVAESEKESLRRLIRNVWTKTLALDFTPL